ncbi:MAG TPA: aminomethyltransferase beta-barrel domain-containing protein [Candidatus Azoamicus sp.]
MQFYTLGKKKKIKTKTIYIYKKNSKTNTIYITKNINKLEINKLEINITSFKNINKFICKAKIRHQENFNICLIKKEQNKIKLIFKKKQIALTAGQHVVLYKLNKCIGGCKFV